MIKGPIKTAREAIAHLKTLGEHIENKEEFKERINDLTKAMDKIEKILRLGFDGPGESSPSTKKDLLKDVKEAKELAQALSGCVVCEPKPEEKSTTV